MLLVSILIPTYNQPRTLGRAIESALSQTYPHKEIVIMDDASTENLDEIVFKYRNYSEIRFVRNKTNIGRVANYREGLYRQAIGDWVMILDGDDYFSNNKYVELVMSLHSQHPDIKLIFGKQFVRDEFTGDQWASPGPNFDSFPEVVELNQNSYALAGDHFLEFCYLLDYGIPHLSAIYDRKHALSRQVQMVDCIASDSESLFRIMGGIRIAFIDEYVGVWNFNRNNESGTLDVTKRFEQLQMIFAPYEFLKKNHLANEQSLEIFCRKMGARSVRDIMFILAQNKKRRELFYFWSKVRSVYGNYYAFRPLLSIRFWAKFVFPDFYRILKSSHGYSNLERGSNQKLKN